MKRGQWTTIAMLLFALAPLPAAADFKLTGPDGRRILLKDDGTWRYVEAKDKDAATDKPEETGEAILSLERRIEDGPNCRFEFRLVNNLPYEIWSIVPSFSVFRPDGVLYESRSVGFVSIKPGNTQNRTVEFQAITCKEIARVQVTGGDRCEMGRLTRFSAETGVCLAKVRLVPSKLLPFEK